jgi:hypothetical protein
MDPSVSWESLTSRMLSLLFLDKVIFTDTLHYIEYRIEGDKMHSASSHDMGKNIATVSANVSLSEQETIFYSKNMNKSTRYIFLV